MKERKDGGALASIGVESDPCRLQVVWSDTFEKRSTHYTFLRQGSNERDSSSSTERSSPVMLSEAKDQRMSRSPECSEGEASRCRSRQTLREARGDTV